MIINKEIVFVRVLIPFISGIVLAWIFPHYYLLFWGIVAGFVQLTVLFLVNVFYLPLRAYYYKGSSGILFCLFWFTLGICNCLIQNEGLKTDHFSKKRNLCLRIRVADEPQQKNNVTRFKAEVICAYFKTKGKLKNRQVCGKLMIAVKKAKPGSFGYGDEFLIPSVIKQVDPPRNPGEFDYKSWLSMQHVYHQTFLNADDVVRLDRNSGNTLMVFALQFRAKQVAFYKRVLPDNESFAMASTLILGYKSDLSKETLDIYSRTGTIHALSVSGMHVGMVYVVLNWLLQFMDRKRILVMTKVIVLLAAIWFYALLTGFSPSVLRSAIMISAFIIARPTVRKTNSYNVLAFAAFCLLIYNPFLLWDVGFQLSFLAVLGLIVLQPKIEYCWPIGNKYLAKLWAAVAISLSAQLFTLPLSIYYFHQFPLYFLLSNLFLMVPAALLMYVGIALLLFRITVLAPVLAWLINFTNKGLALISGLPGSVISGIWISKTELFLWSGSIAVFILVLYFPRKQLLFLSAFLFLGFQCFYSFRQLAHTGQRKTIYFSVRKKTIKAYLRGEVAVLSASQKPISKDFDYFIKPGLGQSGIRKVYWRTILPLAQ